MKNIIKTTAIFIFLILIFSIKSFAQPVLDNPQGEPTVDCKTQIIDPEIEYTYPPDDPGDGGGDDDSDGVENVPPSDKPEEFRRIWFVHGYQGSNSSWEKVATNLKTKENRKYDTYNIHYETSEFNTLEGVAGQIQNICLNGSNSWPREVKENSFFIAHSMGGMALRYMHTFYNGIPKPYAGIITVGTGHKGLHAAEIMTNKPKIFTDFANNTCVTVLHDLVYENLPNVLKNLRIIPMFFDRGYLKSAICDKFDTKPFEFFLSEKIEKELTTTSALNWPNELGIDNDKKIALYGIEEDEMIVEKTDKNGNKIEELVTDVLLPKFFGSMVKSPSDYPVYTADETDDIGLKNFAEAINTFEYKINELNFELAKAIQTNDYAKVNKIKSKIEANKNVLVWLRDANFQYQHLIGGIQNITVQTDYCKCKVETSPNHYSNINYLYNGDCNNLVGTFINGFQVHESHRLIGLGAQKFKSDGFVLTESARAFPGAFEIIEMLGSGHLQMRNDSILGVKFEEIFFGDVYQSFFNLKK